MFASALVAALVASAPVAMAAMIEVDVGANALFAYSPQFVSAMVGDVVKFNFNPKNHTVTQSAFDPPCVPLAGGGFDSGFMPVTAGESPLPSVEFTVTVTTPLWFYCKQKGHCGNGMVFAINPPPTGNKTFDAFQGLAIARNGSTTAATSTTPTVTDTTPYTTPPAPQWASATATVTWAGETYTTTYTSYDGTPAPTPAVTPQNHMITVGANGQLAYSPSNIIAAINDTVTFQFMPKNHTVTQSSFSNPCVPLAAGGFKSGFMPVSADATDFPTFNITVNDTAPIWGYCGQTGHCGAGMVFSINAVENGPNNFSAFQGLAQRVVQASGVAGAPGAATPTTTGGSGSGSVSGSGKSAGMVISPAVGASMGAALFSGFVALFL